MEHHAVAVQRPDLFRCLAADQVEADFGQFLVDQRPDRADEPAGCVDVGRMLVAADEKQILAFAEGTPAADDFVHVRYDVHAGIRRRFPQHRLLDRADHQRGVGRRDYRQFRAPCLGGRAGQRCAVLQLGQALFAKVVQVDRIENESRPGAVAFDQRQVARGDVMPADHDEIEFSAPVAEETLQ